MPGVAEALRAIEPSVACFAYVATPVPTVLTGLIEIKHVRRSAFTGRGAVDARCSHNDGVAVH